MDKRKKELALVRPSLKQLKWQETEFYTFFHFGMNTFTNQEWGDGSESPSLFNPTEFDANQWIESVKAAGIKGVLLTCKHHDGFCLWPSAYTEHSVKNSPFKNGKGDIVKEVSDACRKNGLKFGVYLSPWDRHDKRYGTEEYNDYFIKQLTELLTNYGEIFSVWFDGACGEGPNGKRQRYDWIRYYNTIRQLQPNAVISVSGPDVRWIGNEAGHTRSQEWSVVPKDLFDEDEIRESSQKEDDEEFRRSFDATDDDLGSFDKVKDKETIWWPAEVDVSIRPGWFYHQAEDKQVKSISELMNIYYNAVGGNACLLLNIPPNTKGLLADADVEGLHELGEKIKNYQQNNLALAANLATTSQLNDDYSIENTVKDGPWYWAGDEKSEKNMITLNWPEKISFNILQLEEAIAYGQRIEKYRILAEIDNQMMVVYEGTTIGYRKICRLDEEIKTDKIQIEIISSRWYPTLKKIGVYKGETFLKDYNKS